MASSILQVRDVPEAILEKLRGRAAQQGVSLSAYVRDLLARDAQQPTLAESMARVAERPSLDIDDSDIVRALDEGRR